MAKDVDGKGDVGKDVDGKGDAGKDVDGKGGLADSGDVVNDIVNRASALGGWLIVSIVAPLPPRVRRFAPRGSGPIERAAGNAGALTPGRFVKSGPEPAVQPDLKTNPGTPK